MLTNGRPAELLDALPPHDAEAERACLASMLLDARQVPAVGALLVPDDWYVAAHGQLYGTLLSMQEAGEHLPGQPVDTALLVARLRTAGALDTIGGRPYIAELAQAAGHAFHATAYAQRIADLSLRRRLVECAYRTIEEAIRGAGAAADLLDLAADRIDHLRAQAPSTTARRTTYAANELLSMTLPSPRWAVEGLMPEGLSFLVGRPKIGKSWAALAAAVAVASGGRALGAIRVEAGDVLYLALEDTAGRLQGRLRTILDGEPAPGRLQLDLTWPRLDAGGAERIGRWLTDHPAARLVVVDTWGRIRPPRPKTNDAYALDYADAARLKTVADAHGVAIVAVHHDRKAASADWVDSVSGTLGLTGAADAVLLMARERGQHDAVLRMTGRDVEERELALRWDAGRCLWSLLGDADDYRLGSERQAIIDAIRALGCPCGPTAVATHVGQAVGATKWLMRDMARRGQLRVAARGHYELPAASATPIPLSSLPFPSKKIVETEDREGRRIGGELALGA